MYNVMVFLWPTTKQQDKINRQVLQINRLEKKGQTQEEKLQHLEEQLRRRKSLQWHERVSSIHIEAMVTSVDDSDSENSTGHGVSSLFRLCSAEHVPDDLQRMIVTYDVGFLFLFILFWFHSMDTVSWANI